MRKVRITGLPNKRDGGQGHQTQTQGQGLRRFMDDTRSYDNDLNPFAAPDVQVNKTMQPVDRADATVEGESQEVIMVAGMGGIPETYTLGGKRHADGGTPLNPGKDSFIWSDNKSNKNGMLIKDKDLLKDEFGMTIPKKGFRGFTPAHIAKKYDINEQKKVLMDPNSDNTEREVAEMNIEKFTIKLGKLALVQESMKGFPQGAAKASEGYMSMVGIDPSMFVPQQQQGPPQQQQSQGAPQGPPPQGPPQGAPQEMMPPQMAAYGGDVNRNPSQYSYQKGGQYNGAFWNSIMRNGGDIPYAQNGIVDPNPNSDYNMYDDPNLTDEQYEYAMKKGITYNNSSFLDPEQKGITYNNSKFLDPNTVYPEAQLAASQVASGPQVTEEETIDVTGSEPKVKPSKKETKPKVSKRSTYTYNVPDKYRDNDMYDVESETYDASLIKEGDYIRKADGKWYLAKGLQAISRDYKGNDMDATFGTGENSAALAGSYAYLEETLRDPDVKKEFLKNIKAALRNKEHYKSKRSTAANPIYSEMYTEAEIKALSDDDLLNSFFKHQKRNYSLQAHGIDPKDFEDGNGNLRSAANLAKVMAERKQEDGTLVYSTPQDARAAADKKIADYKTKSISSLNSAFDKYDLGITNDEISAGELGIEQATYWGYHDMLKNRENLSPELQAKIKYLDEPSQGFSDEPEGNISPIDSKKKNLYTNTTAGHLGIVSGEEMSYEEAALADLEETDTDKPYVSQAEDMFINPWAQDEMNLGNLVNTSLSRKKYLGHSFPIDYSDPDLLLHDPARAVANNTEQAGMARRANQAFAGPNATYRNTDIAGKTWAKNLDTIGQYENMNVPIGNAYYDKIFEKDRIISMANSDRMQALYAGNTIANQQWDNTKVADRRNITDARMQMLTNQMETQAWNQQFPNFSTKPGKGGGMWRTGYNRPFINTGMPGQSNNYIAQYQKLKETYPEASDKAIENQLNMNYNIVQSGAYTQPPGQGMRNGTFNPLQSEEAAFAARYGAINPLANYGS